MKKKSKRNLAVTINVILFIFVAVFVIPVGYNNVLKLIYPLKYVEKVSRFSVLYDVDPYLVMGVIKAESNFNPKAESAKNAKGLMQITDTTGAWIAGKIGMKTFSLADLFKPEININLGCAYLKYLASELNGNTDLVILAYNAGIGNVKKWLQNENYTDENGKLIKVPFKETEEFLKRVKNNRENYKSLYKEGIS